MNNIIEYKDWLFVKVTTVSPNYEYKIFGTDLVIYWNGFLQEAIPLHTGSWQIIGKGDQLKEQDWEGIVDKEELFINGVSQGMRYKDYKTEDVSEWFNRCKDSKKSLLRSLGMEPGTTLVLKKQTKLK